jgi:iron complex transport system permease protein
MLSTRGYYVFLVALVLMILLSVMVSLDTGAADIALGQALSDWWQGDESLASTVLTQIRFPRMCLALLVGASLAIAGAAMQMLLRNPLADPGVLGVSGGAALGAVSILYFGFASTAWYLLPTAAILGALLSLMLVYVLAGFQASILALVLSGVAISSITAAMIAVALNFAPSFYAMQEIVFWLMGSLNNRHMDHLFIALPFCIAGWLLMLTRSRFLDALSLGELTAQSLGFNLNPERLLLLLGVALSVGACVAVSGSIGFIGLVVPHLLRPLIGYQPSRLMFASALAGALLLLWADLLVRHLDIARELKLGVVTSLLGAPFFLFLMIKSRSKWV